MQLEGEHIDDDSGGVEVPLDVTELMAAQYKLPEVAIALSKCRMSVS